MFYSIKTDAELSRFLGVAPNTLSNWKKRNTLDLDAVITKCVDINMDWLFKGEGTPEAKEPEEGPTINLIGKGSPYYNVDFAGGFDFLFNDQTTLPEYYIDFRPFNQQGVVWCNLTGHSMEPELSNGDIIALREMLTPIQYLPSGEIYGIVTDESRVVKRVRTNEADGFVRLIPSNKTGGYSDQVIPVDIIRKVYAVLGSIRRFF